MPRPANVAHVVLTGTLPQGESFQTGVWVAYSLPAPTLTELQTYATAAAAAFIASPFGVQLLPPAYRYTELRVYDYQVAGPGPATQQVVAPLNVVGSSVSTNEAPIQTAMVVTTRTDLVGRRYRGRAYLPAIQVDLTDWQFSQGVIDQQADAFAGWLDALNDSAGLTEPRVSIVSTVGSVATAVTAVQVDSRPDVQRRRAEQQAELRQAISQVVTP